MSPIAVHPEETYVNPKYKDKSIEIVTNDGPLPRERIAWLPSLPADSPDSVLRQELEEKGVLHLKGAMPRDYVMAQRTQCVLRGVAHESWFERTACTGILKEGTDPVDGIFCGKNHENYLWPKVLEYNSKKIDEFSSKADYANICAEMHYEEWTNDFSGNEYLMNVVERLFPSWTKPAVVRRQIYRTNVPHADSATSAHYDQLFFRYGPPTAITAWIPIGDIPPEGGGLMYLDHSKPLGEEIEAEYTQMSKDRALTDEQRRYAYNVNMSDLTGGMEAGKYALEKGKHKKWLIGDYEAGDVVFHHMYMVHCSSLNRDEQDRIRLSADLRFVDLDGEYDHRWLDVFHPGDGL